MTEICQYTKQSSSRGLRPAPRPTGHHADVGGSSGRTKFEASSPGALAPSEPNELELPNQTGALSSGY